MQAFVRLSGNGNDSGLVIVLEMPVTPSLPIQHPPVEAQQFENLPDFHGSDSIPFVEEVLEPLFHFFLELLRQWRAWRQSLAKQFFRLGLHRLFQRL
jgi:hypothetical protein